MFCRKCGAVLLDGVSFCAKCGTKAPIDKTDGGLDNTSEKQKEKFIQKTNAKKLFSKKNIKFIALIAAACGFAAVALILFKTLYVPNIAVNAFKKQIESGDYSQAYRSYRDLSSEERTKANEWIRLFITGTEEKYYQGNLDYETASDIFEEMTQFSAASESAMEAEQNIYLDNQASIAFEEAKKLAEEEKWQEAYVKLRSIPAEYRLYDEVSSLQTECAANYRASILEQMKKFADENKLTELINIKEAALEVLPDDMEIISAYKENISACVEKALSDAQSLADTGDYDGALEVIIHVFQQYQGDNRLQTALDTYNGQKNISHCEALAAQGDYLSAMDYLIGFVNRGDSNAALYSEKLEEYKRALTNQTLEKAKSLADNRQFLDALAAIWAVQEVYDCPEFRSAIEEYERALTNQTLETAKSFADSRRFSDAISAIWAVQDVYDCPEFRSAIEEYEKHLPCNLSDCHVIEKYDLDIGKRAKDSFGTEYSNAIVVKNRSSFSSVEYDYAVFFLDGLYINLSGQLVPDAELDSDNHISCKIYGDGVLLYESPTLVRTSYPESFSININGVKQLRVELYSLNKGVWGAPCGILDASVS